MLCGEVGAGRLPGLEVIEEEILRLLTRRTWPEESIDYSHLTREYIDPSASSVTPPPGRMGYALAQDAYRRGLKLPSSPDRLNCFTWSG